MANVDRLRSSVAIRKVLRVEHRLVAVAVFKKHLWCGSRFPILDAFPTVGSLTSIHGYDISGVLFSKYII